MTDPNLRLAHLDWTGGMRFTGGTPNGPTINLDGSGETAPGPMVALLIAMGGCAGADVVSILEKMQVTLTRYSMDLVGRRNEEHPKRYNHVVFTFTIAGEGLTQAKADRAVELSVTKYCSVMLSLRSDIVVETKVIVAE